MKITLKQLITHKENGLYKALSMSGAIASELQEELGLEDYLGRYEGEYLEGYLVKECILYRVAESNVAVFTKSGSYLTMWHSYCDDGVGCLCKRGYFTYQMRDNLNKYQEQLEAIFIEDYQIPKFVQLFDESILEFHEEEK